MKTLTILFFLTILHTTLWAQPPQPSPEDLSKLDFWVGTWDLTWEGGKGQNIIEKKLNGRVIQENFIATEGRTKGFQGTSISIFHSRDGKWHQAWADNQGGYFDFVGEMDGDERIFKTTNPRLLPDGSSVIFRMRFYDIKQNSFVWDWERSTDGGDNWQLAWRINYSRAE